MSISIIVAAAENNAIGRKNDLPWKLGADLKHFSQVTSGKTVLMGLNTYKSILNILGKPLPNRKNVILTFKKDPTIDQEQFTSFDDVLKLAKNEDIFVIGGASVYKQTLPHAKTLYLTRVHTNIDDADAFFPEILESEWTLIDNEPHKKDDKNEFDYTFQKYERK
ncbi:MAG: dihydrofolate reductase [Parcubacteria group bacterium]|nr:dihydrofolate reductase [Parcubacteria group bacterium]